MKELVFLKEKRFQCLQCGECCNAWNLPVEQDVCDRLLAQAWVKNLFEEQKVSFQSKNGEILLPQKDKVCVFYNATKKLCKIHEHGLFDAKPRECKRFPFALSVDSSGKLFVDTSFYCKSIIRNEGILLSEYLDNDFVSSFDPFKFPDKASLFHKYNLENSKIDRIIDHIINRLYDFCLNNDISDWLKAIISIFKLLQKLKKYQPERVDNNLIDLIFLDDSFNCENFSVYAFKIAFFRALILWKKNSIIDFIKLFALKNSYYDTITAENVNLSFLNSCEFVDDPELKEIFFRYLMDIIQRKVLYCHGHSLESLYCVMIAAYCIVLFYSKVFSILVGSRSIDKFALEMAVRSSERYYIGHNVRFLERFRDPYRLLFLKQIILH